MKDKVYFEFYRNFDDYPLSSGFYDSNILTQIKTGEVFYFYHPDSDQMESYIVQDQAVGYCKGYTVLVAVSIDNFTLEEFGLTKKSTEEQRNEMLNFLDDCMCSASKNLTSF